MADQETPQELNTRLAIALLDDDESSLDEMLRVYAPNIIKVLQAKFSLRMGVLRYEDIEDVVAIAIQRVWNARKEYDDTKQSLKVWFFCIAQNVAKDVLKHGWYKARRLERHPGKDWLEENPACTAPEPSPQTASEKRKESKAMTDLRNIVNKLSDIQRTIIVADAGASDGVASSELLADELDIPAAHVRVYRSRAMEKIRLEMRRLGHNIPENRRTKP